MIRLAVISCLAVLGPLVAFPVTERSEAKRPQTLRTVIPKSQNHFMHTGITIPDLGVAEPLGFKRIRSTGARFTRVIIFWNRVVASERRPSPFNPMNPLDPAYDWSVYDAQVERAVAAGLTPMIQIFSAPRWAERCRDGIAGICNPNPSDFEQFTIAAALRYNGSIKPRVKYWQPWNEPNLHIFFKPQKLGDVSLSPILYQDLLSRFAKAVKNIDPGNVVVGGGLAPLGGKNSVGPLAFTKKVLCMEGSPPKPVPGCNYKAPFDIWAVNPYTTGGPTRSAANPDDVQFGDLKEMVALINDARKYGQIETKRKKVPVWITEFSWDSKGPDPKGLPIRLHARWLSESMFRAWQAGIENYFWFSLRDWTMLPGGHPATIESGLWYRGETIEKDKPKLALRAFEFPFVAIRTKWGVRMWGRTKNARPGVVRIQFSRNGKKWKNFRRVKTTSKGIFYKNVRTSAGKGGRGYMRAVFGVRSVPFSLKYVDDFYHYPFG